MKTKFILNPTAGSADQTEPLINLAREVLDADVCRTQADKSATVWVREAVAEGYTRIVAAGGDGTINAAVNGLADAFERVTFGIVPLGTGNDLARTLGLPTDPAAALRLIADGRTHAIDLIEVSAPGKRVYCANVSAGGFSGEVDEKLTAGMKATWGPLAYVIGAVSVLPDLTDYRTLLTFDEEETAEMDVLNVIVANGRTAAGGRPVAPLAAPDDGLLDVVVIENGPALKLAELAARFSSGEYLSHPLVLHRRARRVRVEAKPGMWFNVDGELCTNEPATFQVLPRRLRVVVGSGFEPSVR